VNAAFYASRDVGAIVPGFDPACNESPNLFPSTVNVIDVYNPALKWAFDNDKGTKVALIGNDIPANRLAAENMKEFADANGGELVATEFTPLGTPDWPARSCASSRPEPRSWCSP
jgi:hypothetical protein